MSTALSGLRQCILLALRLDNENVSSVVARMKTWKGRHGERAKQLGHAEIDVNRDEIAISLTIYADEYCMNLCNPV